VSSTEGLTVTCAAAFEMLRSCAWEPPSDPIDAGYQQAVEKLKKSHIWKNNESLRSWLNNVWLSIPEVCNAYELLQIHL